MVDLHTRGVRIVGADGDASLTVREVDMRGPLAIVIGSEGRGLNARVRRRVDVTARIPMRGRVASLNASVAGSVFLFEAATQRWDVPPPPPAAADRAGTTCLATTTAEAGGTRSIVPDDALERLSRMSDAASMPGRSARGRRRGIGRGRRPAPDLTAQTARTRRLRVGRFLRYYSASPPT